MNKHFYSEVAFWLELLTLAFEQSLCQNCSILPTNEMILILPKILLCSWSATLIVLTTHVRAEDPREAGLFSASVECATSYQTTDTVVCDFSLTNNGDCTYSVLKWNTPLNDLAVNGLTVSRDGKELSPEGIMMKREDPGAGAFLTIAAGETVSSKFDLSSEYDTTKAGTYTVAIDLYLEYVEGSAGSLQETKLFYLSSPAVSFQVV